MNRRDFLGCLGGWAAVLLGPKAGAEPGQQQSINNLVTGRFNWTVGPPLVSPAIRPSDPCYSVKDPSIVRYQHRWHLFCTIRSQRRSHQIEYLSFADFKEADRAERHVLRLADGYFAAPQIFFFTPHGRWYLLYQVVVGSRKPALQPAYSTTRDIADPASWTKPSLLFSALPDNVTRWIDFWVICDSSRAHLFFTSLDGRMWRAETTLSAFPGGWSRPGVVLRDDVFEASHTYHLKGHDKFLTVIEAQISGWLEKVFDRIGLHAGWRYNKAYLADRLDGPWSPLATTKDRPFAGLANVRDSGRHWTDSFSHGELIRDGFDERLDLDPGRLRFLFQGVGDQDRKGKNYGEIPWRLGMLEPAPE